MTYAISATKRTGEAAELRASGLIPAVVYGPDIKPFSVAMPYQVFVSLYDKAGDSSIIDLSVEGSSEPTKVLVQDVQYDPVSGRVTHIDFRQINMKKEMTAPVEIVFVGEANAVKSLGGTLVKALSTLNVKCLPQDLVGQIEVDISPLKTFSDTIRIGDISIPAGITVTDSPETTIAKVLAPLTEDQLKAMEEGTGPKSLDEIEVEEKGKKEDAEAGAEGEADAQSDKKE
jgi:large subunit ribosomal protein L25